MSRRHRADFGGKPKRVAAAGIVRQASIVRSRVIKNVAACFAIIA